MTSPDDSSADFPGTRPSTFDEWVQALKEQLSFFTGLKLETGVPRWPLADVLPVLPVVGACVGLASGLVFALVRGISGPGWLAGALAVATSVLVTRALHEDGMADSADGLGPHGIDVTRRLEIMRDSRNGTFGVLAITLDVLVRVACLAQFSGGTGFAVLIAVHAMSRAVLAYPLLAFSPVRQDGLGVLAGKPTDTDVWLSVGIGAALSFVLLVGHGFLVSILAPLGAMVAAWMAARWIAGVIGGYTGDTLGAVEQKAEIAFLIVAVLFIAH